MPSFYLTYPSIEDFAALQQIIGGACLLIIDFFASSEMKLSSLL